MAFSALASAVFASAGGAGAAAAAGAGGAPWAKPLEGRATNTIATVTSAACPLTIDDSGLMAYFGESAGLILQPAGLGNIRADVCRIHANSPNASANDGLRRK